MNLKELNSFKLSDAVTFHDELNPKLWTGNKLRPEVKKQLEIIAEDFLEEMGINDLDVRDITISGSNAAYSYTGHSDLDLHILVNISDLPNNEIYREFFNAKKSLYNDSHDITIHGVPVELYVQDAAQPSITLGEYSLMHDKWLKIPSKRRANFDQTASKLKFEKLLDIVERALHLQDLVKIQKVLKKIKQYRQAGLDKGGEFGPENLAFKALRSQGYITKLYALRDKLHSQHLTIENMYQDPAKIQEAFDQPYKLKWEKGDYGDVDAYAKLPDGNYLSIMFNKGYNQDKEEAWSVEFFRNNSQEVTGEGDAQRVFATVLGAIQTFIKKYKPNRIIFSASKEVEPGQNAQSRARLYDSLVQRYARAWGFRAFRADTGNKVIYELNRINKNVAEGVNTDFFDDPNNIDEIVDAFGYKFSVHKTLNRKSNLSGGSKGDKTYRDVPGITIRAYDPEHPDLTIGHAKFVKETNRLGETWVESDETEVSEKYRGKGIAAMMYAVIKSLGFDIKPSQFQSNYGERMWGKWGKDAKHLSNSDSMLEASGYIPSNAQKNDPRFKTALTVDVKPDSIKKNAKAFSWLTDRAGIPPTAKPSGKI